MKRDIKLFKEAIKKYADANYGNRMKIDISEEELDNLINQFDEPELPVIPKFVADWIEEYGGYYKPSFLALGYDLYSKNITDTKVDKWIADNQELFARAWLDGYEVEPLYYALIKGHELMTDEGDWTRNHWNLSIPNGNVYLSDRFSRDGKNSTRMSKEDWNEYGINETNADFVKVGEM